MVSTYGKYLCACTVLTLWILFITWMISGQCSQLPGYCRHYHRSATTAMVIAQAVEQIDAGYCGEYASMCFQGDLQLQYAANDHNSTCTMRLIEHEPSESNVGFVLAEYPIGFIHEVFLISTRKGVCYFPQNYHDKLVTIRRGFENIFLLLVLFPALLLCLAFAPVICKGGRCTRHLPQETVPGTIADTAPVTVDEEEGIWEYEMSSLLP